VKRILLVEDDMDTQEVYRDILVHAGFSVSTAGDGGDAVRLAREELPDLILMDINLPSMNGWEATKMLKDDSHTQRIPVVAISADAAADNYRRASSLGFESYFAKPISPRDVLAEVRRLIEPEPGG
jgi:two-component system, cell cycle response regulator DivK